MYGLKQAAVLAYNHIKKTLAPHGYEPVQGTTGLWKHKTRKFSFCLCVDDFGIKYFDKKKMLNIYWIKLIQFIIIQQIGGGKIIVDVNYNGTI